MQQDYRCFRCGEIETKFFGEDVDTVEDVPSRRCPACGSHHAMFTFEEMGDILNNIYLEGVDIDLFDPPTDDGEL